MHLKSENQMDDAEDVCPRSHVTGQIGRDGIRPPEQEVGRSDEEGEREEPESNVAVVIVNRAVKARLPPIAVMSGS